jgi:glycine betaine/proline transport system substrate-binding protein
VHAEPNCEIERPIVFAGLDWDSARVHNAIASFIIEKGYGCETRSIPGATIPMFNGVARGDIDIAMEIWQQNMGEAWTKAIESGKVKEVGINFSDGIQGWFVPTYMIEGDPARKIKAVAPDLRSVSDLPRYKHLFRDPEQPDKGRFYNCILGWNCEIVNTKKLAAYNLEDDFTNFRPGADAALSAAIASAYKRGKPVLAYYWGPTWVLGQFDMTQLEEPPYTQECWDTFSAEKAPKTACAYPTAKVYIVANTSFYKKTPKLMSFLKKYRTSSALTSELLAFMQSQDKDEKEAAKYFFEKHPDIWTDWVPENVARQIRSAL